MCDWLGLYVYGACARDSGRGVCCIPLEGGEDLNHLRSHGRSFLRR